MPKKTFRERLAELFQLPPRFVLDEGFRPSVDCRVRPLRHPDKERCEEIYRLNEAAHFPAGFFDKYRERLNSPKILFLVAEVGGGVCGVGGIRVERPSLPVALLTFGMVHPAMKGRGIGTALLLARLAAVPESLLPCTVAMTAVGGSNTFYERFGFRFLDLPPEANEHGLDHYHVYFTRRDRARCERALAMVQVAREEVRAAWNEAHDVEPEAIR